MVIVALGGLLVLYSIWLITDIAPVAPIVTQSAPSVSPAPEQPVSIDVLDVHVTSPLAETIVKSPMKISGEARGAYFFEASFPIVLIDNNNQEIARTVAHATKDWMTTDFVPFESQLAFTTSAKEGALIFENDNPSGLPENAKIFRVPVKFR